MHTAKTDGQYFVVKQLHPLKKKTQSTMIHERRRKGHQSKNYYSEDRLEGEMFKKTFTRGGQESSKGDRKFW